MGIDHFEISGSETLIQHHLENLSYQKFRLAVSDLVGNDNPRESSLDDYDTQIIEPTNVQACIARNDTLYAYNFERARQIIVDGVCLWDCERDHISSLAVTSNPKWQQAKGLFETIPDPRDGVDLSDTIMRSPSSESLIAHNPRELLHGLNMSVLESALAILGLYRCDVLNKEGKLGRWPLLEYAENKQTPFKGPRGVSIWKESLIQDVLMVRDGMKVSLQLRTSCYAAREGDHYFTLNEEGKALVPCESFEKRNVRKPIFHLYMQASIDFSYKRPYATFDLWIASDYQGFRYIGPYPAEEMLQLENVNLEEVKRKQSPVPPRRAIAYNPDISGQFTLDLLPGAAPHRLTMLPLHLQSSKDLVWDKLGSDPERWALWLGFHPFVASINSGLSLRVALTELLSLLKSTSTLEAINQRGWVIEMVVGTLAGLKARLFLLDPLRQPGRLEGVWRAFVEGTRVGLYSGVVVDKLMKVIEGAHHTMSLNSFLIYVVPLQAFVAVGTGTWQILRSPKQSRQVQHTMITSAFDYSMNTLSNAAAIGTGLEAVTGDHPYRLEQILATSLFAMAVSWGQRSNVAYKARVAAVTKYLNAAILSAAFVLEIRSAFAQMDPHETSDNDMIYVRAAAWMGLFLSATAYMIYIVRRLPRSADAVSASDQHQTQPLLGSSPRANDMRPHERDPTTSSALSERSLSTLSSMTPERLSLDRRDSHGSEAPSHLKSRSNSCKSDSSGSKVSFSPNPPARVASKHLLSIEDSQRARSVCSDPLRRVETTEEASLILQVPESTPTLTAPLLWSIQVSSLEESLERPLIARTEESVQSDAGTAESCHAPVDSACQAPESSDPAWSYRSLRRK